MQHYHEASYLRSSIFGKVMSFNENTYKQCVRAPELDLKSDLSIVLYFRPNDICKNTHIITIFTGELLLLIWLAKKYEINANFGRCGSRQTSLLLNIQSGYTVYKWHQLVVVWRPNGFKCQLYLDGKVRNLIKESTSHINDCTYKITIIGCYYRTSTNPLKYWLKYFRGEIASMLIYYQTLNANQVKRLYGKCK
jgi:hypothetical protein